MPFTTGGTPVVPVAGETPATPIKGEMTGGAVSPPRWRRSQSGRDKRGLSRNGQDARCPSRRSRGDRPTGGRSPYMGVAISLHGELRLPTRRVWVSYTAKRRFLRGTSQFAIYEPGMKLSYCGSRRKRCIIMPFWLNRRSCCNL